MLILRAPAQSVSFCTCGDGTSLCPFCAEQAAPAEPRTPCETCDRPLWRRHDFTTGEDEYYCPSCTRFGLAVA